MEYPFFIGGLLIFISALVHSLGNNTLLQYEIDDYLSWIGLANWIPFFWCFWGFKYLDSGKEENYVVLSYCRYISRSYFWIWSIFFNWFGPMKTLFGSIYGSKDLFLKEGMTGLFNNANYLGAWLNLIWPFAWHL